LLFKISPSVPLKNSIGKALSKLKIGIEETLEEEKLQIGSEEYIPPKLPKLANVKRKPLMRRVLPMPPKKNPHRSPQSLKKEDEEIEEVKEVKRISFLRGKDRQKWKEEWEMKIKENKAFITKMQNLRRLLKERREAEYRKKLDKLNNNEIIQRAKRIEEMIKEERAIKIEERKLQFEQKQRERQKARNLLKKPKVQYGKLYKDIQAKVIEDNRLIPLANNNEEYEINQELYNQILNKYATEHDSMSVSPRDGKERFDFNEQISSNNSNNSKEMFNENDELECERIIEKYSRIGLVDDEQD